MPTVYIRQTLAARPGTAGAQLSWRQVAAHLREFYLENQNEKDRKERFAERHRLYSSSGDADLRDMISKVFSHPDVVSKRSEWVEFAKYNNVIRHVVNELATVYSQPAKRTVAGSENNRRYQEVQRLSRQDEVMQRVNRLLLLHRSVVVMPRMRVQPDGVAVPVIDIITPAKFSAVRDPLEPTLLVALLFENDYQLAGGGNAPKYTLWTWHERVWLDAGGEVMETNASQQSLVEEHDFGRIPAILLTIDPPDGQLIDEHTGNDLVAAQKSVSFLNVLMLKEAKSATKQTHIQGDTSRAIRDQADDTETPIETPEGVAVNTVDRAMDFLAFGRAADVVEERAAANFGLSSQVLRQGAVASADARELARVPLRELRLQQQIPFRDFEREFAALQSQVVSRARPDLAFTVDGWSIDFADPQTPLGTSEALDVARKELEMGLTSEIELLSKRNPDLTPDQVVERLLKLIDDRTLRLFAMREFAQMAGGIAQGAVPPEMRGAAIGMRDDMQPADDEQFDEEVAA